MDSPSDPATLPQARKQQPIAPSSSAAYTKSHLSPTKSRRGVISTPAQSRAGVAYAARRWRKSHHRDAQQCSKNSLKPQPLWERKLSSSAGSEERRCARTTRLRARLRDRSPYNDEKIIAAGTSASNLEDFSRQDLRVLKPSLSGRRGGLISGVSAHQADNPT